MAQITAGIALKYGTPSSMDGVPDSWTEVPDIKTIPTLIGDPNTLDATKLSDKQKVYIPGLPDNGGLLSFGCYLTKELFTAYDAMVLAQAEKDLYFRVEYPAPLSKAFQWRGKVASLSNQEHGTDATTDGNLNIVPSTEVTIEDVE